MKKVFDILLHYIATFLFVAMFSTALHAQGDVEGQGVFMPFGENFCLIETQCVTTKEAVNLMHTLEKQGVSVAVIGSPRYWVGWIDVDKKTAILQSRKITNISYGVFEKQANNSHIDEIIVNYFNTIVKGELLFPENSNGHWEGANCTANTNHEPISKDDIIQTLRVAHGQGADSAIDDIMGQPCNAVTANSEYMQGTVSCGIFFLESNGAIDPNSYTWTNPDQTSIHNQVLQAFTIWSYTAQQNSVSVTFTPQWYDNASNVPNQPYEPINHPSTDDGLWINATLANLGYTNPSKLTNCHAFNTWLKGQNGTDWAYSAFIAYNPSPAFTMFNNSSTDVPGYAYLGGPYTQLAFRIGGWLSAQFFQVFGHESGHIFHAFDEYLASSALNCTKVFNGISNTNYHGSSCNGAANCVMVDNTYTGSGNTTRWNMCTPTLSHIGWTNLTPAASLTSPVNNGTVVPGSIVFTWNRNTNNVNISSYLIIRNLSGAQVYCNNVGTLSTKTVTLAAGTYTWRIVNGKDNNSDGWAMRNSTINTVIIGNTLTTTPSSMSFTSSASSQNISVTANISWTASDNVNWITVSPTSGTNNGTVVVSCTANATSNSRSGTVTITGGGITRTTTVTQAGTSSNLTTSPSSMSFTSAASSQNITVTSNLSWTASDNVNWITVSPTSGTNNGTVVVSCTANATSNSRTGTVTITGGGITRTTTVTQAGTSSNLTTSPSSMSFTSSASSQNITVTSYLSWTASDNVNWITVSPTSGTNNGTVTVSCIANATSNSRTGTVTITGGGITRTTTITQVGISATCAAPTGAYAYNATSSSCSFTWNAVTGASYYNMFSWNGSAWVQFGSPVYGTASNITGLQPSTQYCLAVKAVCTNGITSSLSNSSCITTPAANVPCGTPTGVYATNAGTTTCDLYWNAVSGASYYIMFYWNGSSWVQFGNNIYGTSSGITGLSAGTYWCFSIKAMCGNTLSSLSSQACITTQNNQQTCGTPSGLYVTNVGSTSCNLYWNAVSGASYYNLFWWNGSSWVQFGNPVYATNSGITGLSAGGYQYCFAVQAVCSSITSALSSYVCMTTTLLSPPGNDNLTTLKNATTNSINDVHGQVIVVQHIENVFAENSLDAMNSEQSLSAYPNPNTDGKLTIEFFAAIEGNGFIILSDLTGKKLYKKEYSANIGVNHLEIDISELANGIYLLSLNGLTIKIVKE